MRIDQDGQLGLPQHVDEAGGHHHPVRVDGSLGGGARQIADRRNAAVTNADVAGVPGRTGAVDDAAVADDGVVGTGSGQEQSQQEEHGPA